MSGFRGRNRGGGSAGGPPRGLFVNGAWHCDCNPRLPAVHFEVKKEGPNKGKWFRTCQKQTNAQDRCKFFLWDNDAHPREAAALSNNSRTEPGRVGLATPSKRTSPPPPYTMESESSEPKRKRARSIIDLDDYGSGQAHSSFDDELDQARAQVETPSKVNKTSEFVTPSVRRKLPWQNDTTPMIDIDGLQTPQTNGRNDPFNLRPISSASGSKSTPLRAGGLRNDALAATPSSSFEIPTPSRSRNVASEDLVQDVFNLLQESDVRLSSETKDELKSLLSAHVKSAEGYKRGRDVIRTTIRAKEAKITELTYRVGTLEAELEAEKAMVKHLQWEAGSELDTT